MHAACVRRTAGGGAGMRAHTRHQARVKTLALHLLRIYHLFPADAPSLLLDFDARAHAKKFLVGMSVGER